MTGLQLAIGIAAVLFAALIVAIAIDHWQERKAQRSYVPPKPYTIVRPRALDDLFPQDDWVNELGEPAEVPIRRGRVPAWVINAAPKEETLAEFAKRVPDAPALIGCALEAKYELRRLAVSAP